MKTRLILLFFLFLLGACIREGEELNSGPECGENGNVCLLLREADSYQTKAFGNSSATAVEKKVKSAKVFIFDAGGNKIFEKLLSTAELAQVGSASITFTVPGMLPSTPYSCYIIINRGDVIASSLANLKTLTDNDIASYNGDWNSVADAAADTKRSGGFVMIGNTSFTTTVNLTDPQPVPVTVKRITAKLDVTTNIDQTVFGTSVTSKYQGTMGIDSVVVSKTQGTTPLVAATPSTTVGALTLARQVPNVATLNSSYQNRFYVFENGALGAGSRVLLTIYATYTNGSVITPVAYPVELSTDNTGAIVRNGAYAINVKITGLSGANVSVTITLSDWETLVTQNTNAGT